MKLVYSLLNLIPFYQLRIDLSFRDVFKNHWHYSKTRIYKPEVKSLWAKHSFDLFYENIIDLLIIESWQIIWIKITGLFRNRKLCNWYKIPIILETRFVVFQSTNMQSEKDMNYLYSYGVQVVIKLKTRFQVGSF